MIYIHLPPETKAHGEKTASRTAPECPRKVA